LPHQRQPQAEGGEDVNLHSGRSSIQPSLEGSSATLRFYSDLRCPIPERALGARRHQRNRWWPPPNLTAASTPRYPLPDTRTLPTGDSYRMVRMHKVL
jgi:hypothetical protein